MLSVVITAWNEAENLPRVVGSVKSFADEIIVVDTESTDTTVAVAKKLGCKVFSHPNTGIVEPVRNFSISKATGDWILLLDADEEVSVSLANHIQKVVTENKVDYCRIPRQNYIFKKWIKSEHWWPDYVYRLFKKGAITWSPEIHSIPMTRGVGFDFEAEEKQSLIHHHYTSISQFILRLDRYTTIQAAQKTKASFHWTDLIRKPTSEFLNQYFARSAYKDGLHGLVLSLLQAFSELVLYLKLWDFTPENITPEKLSHELAKSASEYRWWRFDQKIKNETNVFKQSWLKLLRKL